MKLILSVVNRDDVYSVTDKLIEAGYETTIISSMGGFLREGNSTLLTGVPASETDAVLAILREHCRARTTYVSPFSPLADGEEALAYAPIEVQVGGAVVFVVNVEQFLKF